MKAIYSLIAVIVVLSFTACTNSENEMMEESSSFELIKSTYGIELASTATAEIDAIPLVSMEDMRSVLEVLRHNTSVSKNCVVESDTRSENINVENKKVIMLGQYSASTRSGVILENFALSVELNFSVDNKQVYYLGTDYTYSSKLFNWRANGLSLSSSKKADGATYDFESQSYLYFKVKDQGNSLVRVPVAFKGSYSFKSEKGTYNFQLANCR